MNVCDMFVILVMSWSSSIKNILGEQSVRLQLLISFNCYHKQVQKIGLSNISNFPSSLKIRRTKKRPSPEHK